MYTIYIQVRVGAWGGKRTSGSVRNSKAFISTLGLALGVLHIIVNGKTLAYMLSRVWYVVKTRGDSLIKLLVMRTYKGPCPQALDACTPRLTRASSRFTHTQLYSKKVHNTQHFQHTTSVT